LDSKVLQNKWILGPRCPMMPPFVLVAVWWRLLLLLLLLSSSGMGLQQQHSSSTTTTKHKKHTALSSYQFSAETGRCVRPRFFVEPPAGDESSDDNTRTAAGNGEEESRLNCGGGRGGNWFELQNVRGDGDCVFLAILQRYGTNDSVDGMRRRVANVLQNGREIVKISAETKVPASALLQQAALELNCSKSEYLHRLRTPGRYGGLYGGLYEYICILCHGQPMKIRTHLRVILSSSLPILCASHYGLG
jgi:hypothetical protein